MFQCDSLKSTLCSHLLKIMEHHLELFLRPHRDKSNPFLSSEFNSWKIHFRIVYYY